MQNPHQMLNFLSKGAVLTALIVASCRTTSAQLATVDVREPLHGDVSYDIDPYSFAPDFPEYPTVIYAGDDRATGTATITDPYASQVPVVITGDADTHTLSKPSIYYTAPQEPTGGPYNVLSNTDFLKFDMGPGPAATGYTRVLQSTAYGATTGYGWGDPSKVSSRDRGGSDPLTRDFCLPSGTPFYVDVENGLYEVSITGGDLTAKSSFSVRAEGALGLWRLDAPSGKNRTDSFRIHVTDSRLRLEFFGSLCPVNAITVRLVTEAEARQKTTIYVAGDSTVSTYGPDSVLVGWGDPLKNYFSDSVRVANYAVPGASSKSFYEQGSLEGILRAVRPGDYIFIMFAINDSADDNSNRKTNSASTFRAYLRAYAKLAREKGAFPVYVTSQTKRTCDPWGRFYNSVQGYPQAMREMGAELDVPVVDLNKMSIDYFTAIGPTKAKECFNDPDYIHFRRFGAEQLARLVAQGVRELDIPLSAHVKNDRPESSVSTQ